MQHKTTVNTLAVQALLLTGILSATAHAQQMWLGTAPGCAAKPNDCEAYDMVYVRSDKRGDGSACWSGTKVLCRAKQAIPGAKWLGTAPFCAAKQSDCKAIDMEYVRSHPFGSGQSCITGTKVLCKPAPHLVKPTTWLGTAPLCGAEPSDCTRYGMNHLTAPAKGTTGYDHFFRGYGKHCTNFKQKVKCEIPATNLGSQGRDDPNTFNIISFNIYALPTVINAPKAREERICRIPLALAKFSADSNLGIDAVAIQEAFEIDCVSDVDLYDLLKLQGWNHIARVPPAANWQANGGILIASRWPIVSEDYRIFDNNFFDDNCEASDCFAAKGVRYARINKQGVFYNIFATHYQAWVGDGARPERLKQSHQFREFIDEQSFAANEAVILAGDFNIDLNLDYHESVDRRGEFKRTAGKELTQNMDVLGANMPKIVFDNAGGTHSDKDFTRLQPTGWLDYVFYSQQHLQPQSATLEPMLIQVQPFTDENLVALSDHLPVLAKFTFPTPAAETLGNPQVIRNIKSGKCLDVRENKNGGRVVIANCGDAGSRPYQQWSTRGRQLLNNRSGRCLDVAENRTGGAVVIADCKSGSLAFQSWTMGNNGNHPAGSQHQNDGSRQCLDVVENRDGGPVVIARCNSPAKTPFQYWH